jgi:23S rRNA (guanosine2251-2'-O)-methyltransferase
MDDRPSRPRDQRPSRPIDDRPGDEGEAGLPRRSRDSGRPPARGAYGPRADDRPWRPERRPAGPASSRPGPGRSGHGRPYGAPPQRLELGEDEEVVAGRRPVEEAFAASRAAHRLLVVPERRAALEQLVLHATTLRIPVVEVEGGSLTALTGFDGHQGVALIVESRRWATLEDVIVAARAASEPPFVLVLDHLEDPQNVGTLLRSAEAAGVHGILFPTRRSAPLTPAAVKASAGATEHLRLVPVDDLAAALVDLHGHGLRIVGADEDAPLTVREVDLRGPLALVVGSEGTGIGSKVRRRVDLVARIPMRGRVGSLNAAVAGSILLFEAVAQRGTVAGGADVGPADPPPPAVDDEAAGEVVPPGDASRGEPSGGTDDGDAAAAEPLPPDVTSDLLPEAPPKRTRSKKPEKQG